MSLSVVAIISFKKGVIILLVTIGKTGFQDVKQDEINFGHLYLVESPCKPFHTANGALVKGEI